MRSAVHPAAPAHFRLCDGAFPGVRSPIPLQPQLKQHRTCLPAAGRSDRAGSRLLFVCAATPAEWSLFHEVPSAQKPQQPVFRVSMYNPLVRRLIRDIYPSRMSKIHAPNCPRCNQPLTWDRTLPAFGPALPDLHSFYCDTCGHAETLAFLAQPTAGHSIAREAGARN